MPIALAGVETGQWLAAHGAGLLLSGGNVAADVLTRIDALDAAGYAGLRAVVESIPDAELICRVDECHGLVARLAGAE